MNGQKIHSSKSIRYLGIHIDETLNFSHNSDILTKKLKRSNGILSKARHFIDIDQLKLCTMPFSPLILLMRVRSGVKVIILTTIEYLLYKIQPFAL